MTTNQLFHEIVERHGPMVLRVCAATLGPGADAEDAWAETFLAALGAFPFDGIDNVEAWLVRVARFKAIDVVRANRRAVPVDPSEVLDPDAAGDTADIERWDDELWNHVAALSERQQFVVAHRFIGQWSYPEIAEKLGCSPAAARRSGSDAIAALRARLRPDSTVQVAPPRGRSTGRTSQGDERRSEPAGVARTTSCDARGGPR